MSQLSLCILSLFLSLISSVTKDIEKSFLQNNSQLLYSLCSAGHQINISLPEPISFSDEVSREQAYFLFKQIFRSYATSEFFPETGAPPSLARGIYIFKASWSFTGRNRNLSRLRIYFYIRSEPGPSKPGGIWKITEIKAERLS